MQDYQKLMSAEVALLKESNENLKKQQKELKNAPDLTPADIEREKRKIEASIQKNKDAMKLYDIKKVELRKTGETIINMKLYEVFLKTIKGMHYVVEAIDGGVQVRYGTSHEMTTGKLLFYNLAHHYAGIAGIPALEEVVTLGQVEIA